MSTKIRELAKQSGFHFYDLHDIDGQDLGETVEADSWSAVDKFAELIVKECATVLDTKIQPPSHPFNSIGHKLKEHYINDEGE